MMLPMANQEMYLFESTLLISQVETAWENTFPL